MMFLPYEQLIIKTNLTSDIASQKLADVIEVRRWIGIWQKHKPYLGKVNNLQFRIMRMIRYENSFLPIIEGKINPDTSGCSIQITMHPNWIVIIFMLVFSGIFLSNFSQFSQIALFFYLPDSPLSKLLSIMGFLLFIYSMVMIGFKIESVRSKVFFRNLFEAYEVEEFGLWNLLDQT